MAKLSINIKNGGKIMALSETGMSPADISAIMGNNDGAFGGNGAWWIIILFLFLFGFGNNGWRNNAGATDNYVLTSDFSQLSRQLDTATDRLAQQGNQIANGLCDGFYTQAQLVNGVNTNILQSANSLQSQLAQCCCSNKEAISNLRYDMANQANGMTNAVNTGFCQTNFNNQNNTRDIIDAQNAGTRAILDAINTNKVEALNQRIAEQNQQISALQLSASQCAQNQYLISQLAPKMPIASYNVPNPFTGGCGYCSCNA